MNRLGLFKRAAGLLAAPTFVSFPAQPAWQTAGVPEPPLPSPGFTTGYMTVGGHPCGPFPYATAYAGHTHALNDLASHSHPILHCPICLRREGHTH